MIEEYKEWHGGGRVLHYGEGIYRGKCTFTIFIS